MRGKELHRYAYDLLMKFKTQHPEFTFWFRQRGEDKFKQGYIFQGNDAYAFVGLYNRGGGSNMTRSVGIVFYPAADGTVGIKLENAFNEEQDQNILSFYEQMRNISGGFRHMGGTNYQKVFTNPIDDLNEFLINQKPQIDKLINEKGLSSFLITEENFQKSLKKITPYLNNSFSTESEATMEITNSALNTILYGPPGTGKTYNTVNKALEILGVNIKGKSRKEIKDEFDKRVLAGEIVFTTFHQSMSYEDFIEGIKPKTVSNSSVIYEVEDGIFKRICNKARFVAGNFDAVIDKLKEDISEEDGKSPLTIQATGTTFDVRYNGTNVFYVQPHNSVKENAWYPVNINYIRKAFEEENYEGLYNNTYIREIIKFLKDNYGLKKSNNNNQEQKKYVLIIDEINRGNVSQIFGELITLIEEDKRQGKPEAITVKLPYSKEEFSVPPNLYILGTMNTADRSVEALDTALRRRFMFEEIVPQPEIIQLQFEKEFLSKCVEFHNLKWEDEKWLKIEENYTDLLNEEELEKFRQVIRDNYKDKMSYEEYYAFWENNNIAIKSVEILYRINSRIEVLVSRDNLIGHAFFIGKYTWASLQTVFHKNIIPLLQEYFYGDFGKIGLVVGEGFFKTVQGEYKLSPFAKFGDYDTSVFLEKPRYELKDISKMEEEEFIEAVQKLLNA
jgi:5-methylcytosine-specific restriction endonuclease McrBC GTP-binding regulatory subunit McrB